jgi:ectoine hydroxylase-related dioxygenase (phytanoyl-CoA dioxygenase family)
MNILEQQGFEILPDCLSAADINALIAALDGASIHRSRAGMRNVLQLEAVLSLALDPLLLKFATSALGEQALPFRATLFDKSPDSNWLVVWHQDTALPLRERRDATGWGPFSVKEGVICAHAPAAALEQVLAIRIHLDNSTTENGPLRVLPGTHKSGVLSDDAIHDLSLKVHEVVCEVPSGGILLMKPLLVHASSKVLQSKRRRVLHLEYCSRSTFDGGLELPIAC